MDSAPKQREPDYPEQDRNPLNASTPILTQPPKAPGPVPRYVVWVHRISIIVFVVFCVELGVFIAVVPWLPIWTQNIFVLRHPPLREFLTNNFVRGLITGLGVIDVWVGIWEAVHYHDPVAVPEIQD